MKSIVPTLVALLIALTANAVEDKDVQGNYGERDTNTVHAKVIAEGGGNYRVLLDYGDGQTELKGTTPEKDAAPVFTGKVKMGTSELGVEGVYRREANGEAFIDLTLQGGVQMFLTRLDLGSPTRGAKPPKGAIVLLDGTNLDEWYTRPEKWHLHSSGDMQVANPELITHREFGDHKMHLEFQTPFMPHERGQARGNSGVYIHGVYEVQVLDSFGLPPADNDCGGIYKIAVPSMNASLPPLEWQTYDITFRAPRFDNDGNKTENARITVVHNGHTIHDDIEIPGLTGGALRDYEAPKGPLKLQHHHDPVHYRNIWVQPLED